VVGGFHLPADGGVFEGAIDPTLKELQKIDCNYIIPCHCTGWKATAKIIDLMPDKFIQSAVEITLVYHKDLSTTLNALSLQQVKYGIKVGSVINGDQCITYLNYCHANSSCDSYVWLDMHQA